MTGAGVEIDLVVERPGQPLLLIEIKSATIVRKEDLHAFQTIVKEIGVCESVCFCNESRKKKIGDVIVYPWQKGIATYFSQDK